MHEESPPAKNSFLEDLDKLDVSISSRNENEHKEIFTTNTHITVIVGSKRVMPWTA